MPKTARSAESNGNGAHSVTPSSNGAAGAIRTTIILPEALDWNLAAWCVRNRFRKNEGIVQILTRFLASQGLQPDRAPDIKIGYDR